MIEFGGWEMPVQYTSILKEHMAVRSTVGLFDISHMGEIRVQGPGALSFLNRALTNNLEKVSVKGSQYSILLNERGGVVDDLFVYRLDQEEFLLVVNASHIEEDFEILSAMPHPKVVLTNESERTSALALQGPKSSEVLETWIPGASMQLGHHEIRNFLSSLGEIWIARTGYTGEDGFEILCSTDRIVEIWNILLDLGKALDLIPCGLGARDTLRTEVCYPLNGHELGPDITPLEAGIGFFVDLTKSDFVGKAALMAQKAVGIPRKLVAVMAKPGGAPLRAGYPVYRAGRRIGVLTSGILSPTLQTGIGLALVDSTESEVGNAVDIEIRNKYVPANIVRKPFYRRSS